MQNSDPTFLFHQKKNKILIFTHGTSESKKISIRVWKEEENLQLPLGSEQNRSGTY